MFPPCGSGRRLPLTLIELPAAPDPGESLTNPEADADEAAEPANARQAAPTTRARPVLRMMLERMCVTSFLGSRSDVIGGDGSWEVGVWNRGLPRGIGEGVRTYRPVPRPGTPSSWALTAIAVSAKSSWPRSAIEAPRRSATRSKTAT